MELKTVFREIKLFDTRTNRLQTIPLVQPEEKNPVIYELMMGFGRFTDVLLFAFDTSLFADYRICSYNLHTGETAEIDTGVDRNSPRAVKEEFAGLLNSKEGTPHRNFTW